MTPTAEMVTLLLSLLTILGQVFILFIIIQASTKNGRIALQKVLPPRRALFLSFLVSLFTVLGSLYYSEIVGFAVCKLCWAQRIFLYPQVILLGLALWRRDLGIALYSIALALLGVFFAIYHILVQASAGGISCGTGGASCSKVYFTEFGYITFPVMALTSLVLIIIFSGLSFVGNQRSE